MVTISMYGQYINISGRIVTEKGTPISKAKVFTSKTNITFTDAQGNYSLSIPKNTNITLEIEHPDFNFISQPIQASSNDIVLDISLKALVEKEIPEIIFKGTRKSSDLTTKQIDIQNINKMPSISGGIEEILNTAFVSTADELSSFYRVRGGNYDENLVYLNGVEIYKPLTVRSGQQEGMSIINPNMVSTVNFSAGGFEARYGDKMSSVLDINYRRPKKFESILEASLLGGSATIGFADKNQKFSGIGGIRYRNTDMILNTMNGDTNFNPEYFDAQTFLKYEFNPKWNISFLGIYSSNNFEMVPKTREVEFGTLTHPIKINVAYNGKEKDKYRTLNGTFSLQFKPIHKWIFALDGYAFHSKEKEYFDISSGYLIRDFDTETGEMVPSYNYGGQIDHGRNNLDMFVTGTQLKTQYSITVNSILEAGIKYQNEDIRNLMNQWQLIDSIDYSIPHPISPPGELDSSDLILNNSRNANNKLSSNRLNGYLQYTTKFMWNNTRILINAGIRVSHWDFNGKTDFSPRAQIGIKPNWDIDMLFRFATGFYYQPPFYKEAMRLDGSLNENIKSQRSVHFILGNDYEFTMLKKRPFKLTTEIYYKKLDDLIPYFVDNVRIIYSGENNSKGYAYGIDARLNGEFVPGAESWISVSYGRTKENIDGKGYIPRPTDPKFKVGLFFQDYMKEYPQLKASVNLVYASGLPNGAPLFSDPYKYQTKLSDYKRADVGLTYVFVDQGLNKAKKSSSLKKLKELSLGLEIFNVFDIKNTISNQWIRDINSSFSYAVPNKSTGRFFNVKLNVKF